MIPDASVIFNVERSIQGTNLTTPALSMASRDPLEGKPVELFLPEKDRHDFKTRLMEFQAAKQARECESAL
ncbi:MAG: hypothetical protein GX422_13260 [Deltaproteobacteria bacterium]|nr:hypothetical protein [Deltaproteobacteria bacterium]